MRSTQPRSKNLAFMRFLSARRVDLGYNEPSAHRGRRKLP